MGEIRKLILEGILCDTCFGLIEDILPTINDEGGHLQEGPGYPRSCESCNIESEGGY